jgi:phage baseplate assembly protein gpV
MRWLLAVVAVSFLALSGCVSVDGSSALDCTSSSSQAVGVQRSMLLPEEPAETPYDEDGNTITVQAREGQDIVAVAIWKVSAGQAQVKFDGPSTHLVSTQDTWTMTTYDVPAGEYSLTMVGSPFAVDVGYTLQIIASGCTPVE